MIFNEFLFFYEFEWRSHMLDDQVPQCAQAADALYVLLGQHARVKPAQWRYRWTTMTRLAARDARKPCERTGFQ